MTIVDLEASISNVESPDVEITDRFFVDAGLEFSILPESIWKPLKIVSTGEQEYIHVGYEITHVRDIAMVRIKTSAGEAITKALLGEPDDAKIIGMDYFEKLGLLFHPFTREIVPRAEPIVQPPTNYRYS